MNELTFGRCYDVSNAIANQNFFFKYFETILNCDKVVIPFYNFISSKIIFFIKKCNI